MNKTSLTASKAMSYGGRRMSAGDTFEASPRDARLLIAIGSAAPAVVPKPEVVMTQPERPTPEPIKPKRTYQRRDMQAGK